MLTNKHMTSTNKKLTIPPRSNENKCVVRLRTTAWTDARGVHRKQSITFLRNKCNGFNVLDEDSKNSDAESIFDRIPDLSAYDDGVYEVITCNETRDWETGYVDDYDYKLIPLDRPRGANLIQLADCNKSCDYSMVSAIVPSVQHLKSSHDERYRVEYEELCKEEYYVKIEQ